MKNAGIYKLLTAILTIGIAALWTMKAGGAVRTKAWSKLPDLVLRECLAADQSVIPNPFSKSGKDFFVITQYEEYGDNGPVIKKKPDARGSIESLNVYLVLGVFMAEDMPVGFVHQMALIVLERNTDAHRGKGPSLRRWILSDENGDGILDKGMLAESVNGKADKTGKWQDVEILSEQVANLQGYFEKAIHSLFKKAAGGADKTCVTS
jgi:hypothetical protein